MTACPEVSVVLSVYNRAQHLMETLQSVLSQQDVRLELVAVNDGSTDDSGRILDAVAATDSRLRVLHQKNQGLTRALIRGCEEARAPYVARQDASDLSLPGRLTRQKQALDASSGLAFLSCWTEICGPRLEPLYVSRGRDRAQLPTSIISLRHRNGIIDGPSHHGSVMFRKVSYVAAGGYREAFRYGQDWDLWYRLAEQGQFQMLPRLLYRARVMVGDLSTTHHRVQMALGRLSEKAMRHRAQGRSDAEVVERARMVSARPTSSLQARDRARGLYFISECLRRNRDPRSRGYLAESLAADPWLFRAWLRLLQANLS